MTDKCRRPLSPRGPVSSWHFILYKTRLLSISYHVLWASISGFDSLVIVGSTKPWISNFIENLQREDVYTCISYIMILSTRLYGPWFISSDFGQHTSDVHATDKTLHCCVWCYFAHPNIKKSKEQMWINKTLIHCELYRWISWRWPSAANDCLGFLHQERIT